MGNFADKIMSQLLGQVDDARKKALKEAVKIVKKDIKEKVSDRAVMDYYMDYTPTIYKRSYSLFNVFKSYARQDGRTIHAWIEYDSDRMGQHYSNSPRHKSGGTWISRWYENFDPEGDGNGIPDSGWIFDRFWEGTHPRYYIDWEISKLVGEPTVVDNSYHFESTEFRMLRYAEQYQDRLEEIIEERMLAQL